MDNNPWSGWIAVPIPIRPKSGSRMFARCPRESICSSCACRTVAAQARFSLAASRCARARLPQLAERDLAQVVRDGERRGRDRLDLIDPRAASSAPDATARSRPRARPRSPVRVRVAKQQLMMARPRPSNYQRTIAFPQAMANLRKLEDTTEAAKVFAEKKRTRSSRGASCDLQPPSMRDGLSARPTWRPPSRRGVWSASAGACS